MLNEKEPNKPKVEIKIPTPIKAKVVSDSVSTLRDHPDLRIARRAMTLSRLAQVISERKVGKGLRKTLLTQAERLEWLAKTRYESAADIMGDDDNGTE